jgi:hypothetical protein
MFSSPVYKNVIEVVLLSEQAAMHKIPNIAFKCHQVCPNCKYLDSRYNGVTI